MKLTNLQINYIEKCLESAEVETDLNLDADLTAEQIEQLRQESHGRKKPWEGEAKDYRTDNPLYALVFSYAKNIHEYQRMNDMYQWERIVTKDEEARDFYDQKGKDLDQREAALEEVATTLGIDLNDLKRRATNVYVKMSWEYQNSNSSWDVDGMNAYLHEQANPELPE